MNRSATNYKVIEYSLTILLSVDLNDFVGCFVQFVFFKVEIDITVLESKSTLCHSKPKKMSVTVISHSLLMCISCSSVVNVKVKPLEVEEKHPQQMRDPLRVIQQPTVPSKFWLFVSVQIPTSTIDRD